MAFPSPCLRREEPRLSHKINLIKSAILSSQTIALNSEHWIHLDEPDLVMNAIRAMIGAPPIAVAAEAEPMMAFVADPALPKTLHFSLFPAPRAEDLFAITRFAVHSSEFSVRGPL